MIAMLILAKVFSEDFESVVCKVYLDGKSQSQIMREYSITFEQFHSARHSLKFIQEPSL